MKTPEERVDRAVRLTPPVDRPRYEPEWRSDLAAAAQQGLEAGDVGRAAQRLAVRLRARQLERMLLGAQGVRRALAAWGCLAGLFVVTFLLGGIFLLVGVAVVVLAVIVLARAGTPSHWTHWLMVASIITGIGSAAFVWWVAGVSVDSADNFTPMPPAAHWGGAGIVVFLLSGVALLASAIGASVRERHAG